MNKLCQKTPTPTCKYDYLSVASAKYATLHEKNPDNKSYLDSAIVYSRRTISIIEQYPDQLPPKALKALSPKRLLSSFTHILRTPIFCAHAGKLTSGVAA